MTRSRRRRGAAGRRPEPWSATDLLIFFTIFAALTNATAPLEAPNSVKIALLVVAALLAFVLVQSVRQHSIVDIARDASRRGRLLFLLVILLTLALLLAIHPAAEHLGAAPDQRGPPALSSPSAYVRYHVMSAVTLRAGPGLQYAEVQDIGAGTAVDITCQTRGTTFRGSRIWSRLTGGQWVPDAMTDSPNHGQDTLSPPGRWC